MKFGTTFDYEQAQNLGLDYKEVLERIVSLKLSPIRIGIKWNKVEGKRKKYNWDIYDNILAMLDKHKIPIVLAIGMKSPRWPEFFIPEWVNLKLIENSVVSGEDIDLKDNLFDFISKVLKRYKDLKCIKYIQVENEPFLKAGPYKNSISYKFLENEINFIKTLTNLPIILNAQGLPTTGTFAEYLKGRNSYKKKLIKLSDIFGINIFPKFEGKIFNKANKEFSASCFAWWYLKKLFNKTNNLKKKCFVTELQAEPWQFGDVDLYDAYANKTCNPDMVRDYIDRLRKIGLENILIWGVEFHIACEKKGNDGWIKKIYSHFQSSSSVN